MYEEGTNNAYEVTEIVIPNTITGIGQYQFIGFAIESIVIPTSVIEIDDGAFNLCNNLTNIYYAGSQQQWNNIDGHANAEKSGRTITYNYN